MTAETGTGKTAHRLFVLTLLGKGLLGIIQLATAAAILMGFAQKLPDVAHWLFRAELAENPKDFFATKVLSLLDQLPQTDMSFYTIYFAAHGALHVAVVAALIHGATWAAFAALAVLAAFVVYQAIEWFSLGGVTLIVLTCIDLAVIVLTLIEMRRKGALPVKAPR